MSLDKIAVCTCLNRSQPKMRKQDKRVTTEVQTSHNAGRSSGRYMKELYTRENRMTIEGPMNELRGFWREISHPWMERGWGITPVSLLTKSEDILAQLVENVNVADQFAKDNFDHWKRDAELDLGDMHNIGDYPTNAEFSARFRVTLERMPVPIRVPSNQLHALIEQDKNLDIEAMRVMIQDAESKNLRCVTEACAKRVYDATEHIIEGITHKQTPKKAGSKRDNNYRDSLIGNVWDLVQLLPELNLADSPEIADLHDRLKRGILAKLDVDNIAKSDKKKRMKSELSRMRSNLDLENSVRAEARKIMEVAGAILPKPAEDF